jgi:hypothetical protein
LIFHSWEFFIGAETSAGLPYPFFSFLETTHVFLFNRAGLWIAMTSFFLFGFLGARLALWRVFFCLVGILAVQYIGQNELDLTHLENYSWGVFSFILTGYWVLLVTKYLPLMIRSLIHLLFAALLFIPHSLMGVWLNLPSGFLKQALVGDYISADWPSGWFLLPWLGALLLCFEVGFWLRHFQKFFRRWHMLFDFSFFLILLASLAAFILRGPEFAGGAKFSHSIFWVEPIDLAYTILLPIWIYRLAQIQKIQLWLASQTIVQKISRLNWNQHFWFCYIIHLAIFYILQVTLSSPVAVSPWVVQPLGPIVMVLTEVIAHYFFKRQFEYKKSLKLSLEN